MVEVTNEEQQEKLNEDGRVTVLTDKELVEEIEKCCKELNVTIGA